MKSLREVQVFNNKNVFTLRERIVLWRYMYGLHYRKNKLENMRRKKGQINLSTRIASFIGDSSLMYSFSSE